MKKFEQEEWDRFWKKIYTILGHDAICNLHFGDLMTRGCSCGNDKKVKKLNKLFIKEKFYEANTSKI